MVLKETNMPKNIVKMFFFPPPMPPHVLTNFCGFPPGCGDSVADFWGWDAHEVRLRFPDDVSGDMQGDEIPGGALTLIVLMWRIGWAHNNARK